MCGLNPAYASMWKCLKSLDDYTLDCLPVDNCREFELDPAFEEKMVALSLNFFDWQKLEQETSNPTIRNALKEIIIELNLALTTEDCQKIANSTSIPAVRLTLESEGIKAKEVPWIHVDSSCIDAVAYPNAVEHSQQESVLQIRFNSGQVYQYYRVPHEIFLRLLNTNSKGSYFNRYIKDIFAYTNISNFF
jgi:hypothetical protein